MLLPYNYLEKGCVKHTSMPYSVSLLFVKSSWELILTCVVSFCLHKSDIQVPFSDRNSMDSYRTKMYIKWYSFLFSIFQIRLLFWYCYKSVVRVFSSSFFEPFKSCAFIIYVIVFRTLFFYYKLNKGFRCFNVFVKWYYY